MNESGMSLVETMCTLSIMMLLTGSLIPLHTQLNKTLLHQKLQLHASEVAFQGASQVAAGRATQGTLKVENVVYDWEWTNNRICVRFVSMKGVQLKCIDTQGTIR